MLNVSTATTAELVAFYNEHNADKPVKKFADRKTAERRVSALLATVKPAKKAEPVPARGKCPRCGATEDITCGEVKELHGHQHIVNEHIAFCHVCGHSWDINNGRTVRERKAAASSDRSAAIAASWTNKKVAAARATRHGVRVTDPRGGQGNYKSVREAFMVLALPIGQHIKFRGALKAAGKAEFGKFKFALIERA